MRGHCSIWALIKKETRELGSSFPVAAGWVVGLWFHSRYLNFGWDDFLSACLLMALHIVLYCIWMLGFWSRSMHSRRCVYSSRIGPCEMPCHQGDAFVILAASFDFHSSKFHSDSHLPRTTPQIQCLIQNASMSPQLLYRISCKMDLRRPPRPSYLRCGGNWSSSCCGGSKC